MGLVFAIMFVAFIVSAKLATEPIFPLRMMGQYPVWTNYLLCALQVLVQFSLAMIIPVYFQVTAKAKTCCGWSIPHSGIHGQHCRWTDIRLLDQVHRKV